MKNSNLIGKINSIETMGLVDGPGVRVVVFMQGCNLRCIYCHNPETWSLDSKNNMSVDEVVNKVLRYKNYIENNGGVTFSGGEPLLQSNFIYECAQKLKEYNIHICVDTAGNGYDYERLIDLVDLFIIDVKSSDCSLYKYITGQDNQKFNEFIELVQKKNKKIWIRQVIVPGINDNEENIISLASYVNTLTNIEKVELLPYHTLGKDKYNKLNIKYRLEKIDNLSNEKLEYLKEVLNNNLDLK